MQIRVTKLLMKGGFREGKGLLFLVSYGIQRGIDLLVIMLVDPQHREPREGIYTDEDAHDNSVSQDVRVPLENKAQERDSRSGSV